MGMADALLSGRRGGSRLRNFLLRHAVTYFTVARSPAGRPLDPVSRFHVGNGARLEQMNWRGDVSRTA